MKEIIEYKVVHATGIDAFQKAIDKAVNEGWQPAFATCSSSAWSRTTGTSTCSKHTIITKRMRSS